MQVSYAAEPGGGAADSGNAADPGIRALADAGPLRHELRTNLVVALFTLGLSVAVAVGLSLLMTLLG
jgi:hypothetical protein